MVGLVVSGGMDKLILVWDPLTPAEPVYTLVGHEDTVCSLDVTPDGSIVSASWDKYAVIVVLMR
jgi:phospholipase A-2-activating protein